MKKHTQKTRPLVSVMMPVYNAEQDIGTAINSLLLQDYRHWELIVVNDGSTDGTLKKINAYKDERIRVFSFKTNKGRPYARQKALNESRGKYIAMLDADDWYYPEKLSVQVALLEEHSDCVLAGSAMALTKENGRLDVVQKLKNNGKTVKAFMFENPINYIPIPHAPSMMLAKKAKAIEYDPALNYCEDQDFLIRLLKGEKHLFYNEVLYVYNLGQSTSLKKYVQGQKATDVMWTKQLKGTNTKALLLKKTVIRAKICLAVFLKRVGLFGYLSVRRGIKPTAGEKMKFDSCCNRIKQPF